MISKPGDARQRGTATQQQQHAWWRNTYQEHARHVLDRAHVPVFDVLVEGIGQLQYIRRRMVVSSERRFQIQGDGDTRTSNILRMFVTELVFH